MYVRGLKREVKANVTPAPFPQVTVTWDGTALPAGHLCEPLPVVG